MAQKIPVKGNDGFFLQVDKIFLDLLHCTNLNIYGILILAQVYEFKRNKKACVMSTQVFCDLFKTSHYTVENQLKILCDLGLIHKVVKTNQKNTISRVRELTIPQNCSKIIEHLLKNNANKQPTNFEVPSPKKTRSKRKNLSDLQPTNLGVASTSEASSNFDGKQAQNSYESNPQNLQYNNIKDTDKNNNKLLEDENTPSLTSSNDDSVASKDALFGDALINLNTDTNNNSGDENLMPRYPNQKEEEISEWFEKLNPISRYHYELKYKKAAKSFAWGERDKKENQHNYYTPDQIIEYFTLEKRLDYLKEINWEYLWMIDI